MNIKDVFLHNFYSGSLVGKQVEFLNLLNSILKYSLVSYNYYYNVLLNNQNIYKQHYNENTFGYSKDYISLINPSGINDFNYYDLINFIEYGSFILLKKDFIQSKINENSKETIFSNPSAVIYDYIYEYGEEHGYQEIIDDGIFVLPGEVKIRDFIPKEEIIGLAFSDYFLEKANLLTTLREENMTNLPLYLYEYTDLDNIKLKKLN